MFTGGDMTKNDALKLALEALESWAKGFPDLVEDLDKQAITTIKQALSTRQSLPDAITDNSESPEFRAGWNECREVMAGMMK